MKKIIIHGHFYQPPRENPWTGRLEDQKEAAPSSNWNTRICRECYEANAFSPLLDGGGMVERFFNNYEHISFNAGPTLLSWLETEAPHVYAKILEGDRISALKKGNGNAIAQVYNHIILPLASERDRRTQITWSLEDFKSRFKRDSRGLWLSETAICPDTAEEMIRSGIEYTILSPYQAERFIFDLPGANGKEGLEQLWKHPWTLVRPSGKLRIYFYHPGLSAGISFNHLLRDADNLYSIIRSELQESDLLTVATDGEIYGHHELLGNMGLSAVLAKIEADPELENVNFSQLCDSLPTAGQVILKKGEDHRGSSWSCSHGVSRWYKDCGCTTGSREGWNQKWRAPLKEAVDRLNRRAETVFSREIQKLLPGEEPDRVRDEYISVLNGSIEASDFLSARGIGDKGNQKKILRLLEGQRYAMYMFTSCGWFFADISGVEPLQNLLYAARLFELYEGQLPREAEEEFLETLSKARSNLPEKGSAAELYRKGLSTRNSGLCRYAASLILTGFYGLDTMEQGDLRLSRAATPVKRGAGKIEGLSGTAELVDRHGLSQHNVSFVIREDDISFTDITVTLNGQNCRYSLKDLNPEVQKAILGSFTAACRHPAPGAFPRLLMRFNSGSQAITAAAHSALYEILILMEGGDAESWTAFKTLLSSELLKDIPLPTGFTEKFYKALEKTLSQRGKGSDEGAAGRILETLPLFSLPAGLPEMSASLRGRIYDLYRNSEQGERVCKGLDKEQLQRLKTLLKLSDRIAFQ